MYLSGAQIDQANGVPIWTLLHLVYKLRQLRMSSATVINLQTKTNMKHIIVHMKFTNLGRKSKCAP